jgi:pilus assembly protein CpaF
VRTGALTEAMARYLSAAVRGRLNIVIAGGTGSGKTSLLDALGGCMPARERVVTIEDLAELRLEHPQCLALEGRPPNVEGRGEITLTDLVREALRMRPDRLIIGEVRGPEAFAFLQAMNTGHPGSLLTIHANSPEEVPRRLETLVLMAGVPMRPQDVRDYR